ncbi:hypothetical protein Tco_0461334 [Tanacetum coccineum]
MSSSSSFSSHATVTYTSVSTDRNLPPWGFLLMEAYEPEALEAAPQSPEQAPLSHVPAPEYPEYLEPSDDDILAEDQPLPADASPTGRLILSRMTQRRIPRWISLIIPLMRRRKRRSLQL